MSKEQEKLNELFGELKIGNDERIKKHKDAAYNRTMWLGLGMYVCLYILRWLIH